mgnify:CR=1 FL=1
MGRTILPQSIADRCWCSADCANQLSGHTLSCQENLRRCRCHHCGALAAEHSGDGGCYDFMPFG